MDNQRRGACNHIMAVWDSHSLCPGCRDCFIPDNPSLVCEGLTAEQRARSIQARALRLRRQARRAGSAGSVSGSSQCGPVEGKAFGPLGSTPEPSVKGQGGMGLTSPRSVVSRDGGRGSPSAASLSSVAADDGDTGRNTSLGPRSQDGGSGGVRSSYPPLRGAAEALSRQAFRRRSRTPVRLRHSSESSLDAYAYATVLPTGAARTRTGPGPDQTGPDRTRTGPGPDQTGPDRTWDGPDRTGPGMDRTRNGPDQDRTGPEAAGSRDQERTSRSCGMPVKWTAAAVRANEDSVTRPCPPLLRRCLSTGENRGAIDIVVDMAGADVVTAP